MTKSKSELKKEFLATMEGKSVDECIDFWLNIIDQQQEQWKEEASKQYALGQNEGIEYTEDRLREKIERLKVRALPLQPFDLGYKKALSDILALLNKE